MSIYWTLVIMIIGSGASIQNVAFPDRDLCETARQAVLAQWSASDEARHLRAVCVQTSKAPN